MDIYSAFNRKEKCQEWDRELGFGLTWEKVSQQVPDNCQGAPGMCPPRFPAAGSLLSLHQL